ncbi:MAG: arginine repressor [Propionibacteriaceae bacterium]|jgi:transcriptional regulator of arginine metabolism|nr:arginine repressor [Propionibacteriaceae bacterium]
MPKTAPVVTSKQGGTTFIRGQSTDRRTKTARQARIIALIEQSCISSQAELAAALAADGVRVTQGTLSRDLVDIGAARTRNSAGELCYSIVPQLESSAAHEKLAKLAQELLVKAAGSANLAVLHTPPGAAQFFASAIDKVGWDAVLGTIAGDDTVVIITKDPAGGEKMAAEFAQLSQSRAKKETKQ